MGVLLPLPPESTCSITSSPQGDFFFFLGFSVAMNMQTAGSAMDICDGFFRQNGGSGYVLKPEFLCDIQSSFDPERPISLYQAKVLLVQV